MLQYHAVLVNAASRKRKRPAWRRTLKRPPRIKRGGRSPAQTYAGSKLLAELRVLLAEAVDAAGGVHEALLAGEEGMAGGADFGVDGLALGGKHFDDVAAGADELGLVHFGMDALFHGKLLICGPTGSPIPTLAGGQSPSRPIYRSLRLGKGHYACF